MPLNESWGVQHIAHNPAMRDYARTLFHLTKTLDQMSESRCSQPSLEMTGRVGSSALVRWYSVRA